MIDNKLEKRLAALEEAVQRLETKNRGYLTQSAAAEYIGRSKEFLRERHVRGDGPKRMPNGMYAIRDLDEWMQREAKPNVHINPKASPVIKHILSDVFPDANALTPEKAQELLDKALQGKRNE